MRQRGTSTKAGRCARGSSSNGTTNQPARVCHMPARRLRCQLGDLLRAVDAVEQTTPDGFAAIKVTALATLLLERVSIAVAELTTSFTRSTSRGGTLAFTVPKGLVQAFESARRRRSTLRPDPRCWSRCRTQDAVAGRAAAQS